MKPLRMIRPLNMYFVALAALFPVNWMAGFAQAPLAQPRPAIIVSGTICDPVGNPIADASVSFEEKATSASIEAKTAPNGTFSFLTLRAGTYVVRVQKEGFREAASGPLRLSLGQRKELDLVLSVAIGNYTSLSEKPPSQFAPQPSAKEFDNKLEFDDKPSFTVAGITDSTNFGGHGSVRRAWRNFGKRIGCKSRGRLTPRIRRSRRAIRRSPRRRPRIRTSGW